MDRNLKFALNQIATPGLSSREFIDLASRLGCVGVELRNDLADKGLTTREFFGGEELLAIGAYARAKGVRVLGLSEVYAFNRWSDAIRDKTKLLIAQAKETGAETISLIPSNDGAKEDDEKRQGGLRKALGFILPMLEDADLVALVEPLGFTTSSLRRKREAIAAIEAVGGKGRFKLVHDTFHHFIAGETEFFPDWTGIVHISGIVDPALLPNQMRDSHRILVDEADRLRNIEQIETLADSGYAGAYSYEPFSVSVHSNPDIEPSLRASIDLIEATAMRGSA